MYYSPEQKLVLLYPLVHALNIDIITLYYKELPEEVSFSRLEASKRRDARVKLYIDLKG